MTRAGKSLIAPAHSAFDDLLAAEQEIAGLVSASERACEERLAAARASADEKERAAAGELERELAAQDESARAACAAAVRAIEDDAARAVDRYRSLSAAEIELLAREVAAEATGLAQEATP